MTGKHSPAPWKVRFYLIDDGIRYGVSIGTNDNHIATVWQLSCRHMTVETRANVDLILSAPDMADALLDLHRYNQADPNYLSSPAAQKANVALVKAGMLTPEGELT